MTTEAVGTTYACFAAGTLRVASRFCISASLRARQNKPIFLHFGRFCQV
jgi:hypothetical protein